MTTHLKTLSICGVVAGLVFGFLGLNARNSRRELAEKGSSTPGVISAAKIQSGAKNKKLYYLYVTWGEGAGRQTDQAFKVTKSFFHQKANQQTAVVFPDVAIQSLPGDPTSAIIVGGSSDLGGMEWLGLAVGLAGAWGTYKGFLRKPRLAAA